MVTVSLLTTEQRAELLAVLLDDQDVRATALAQCDPQTLLDVEEEARSVRTHNAEQALVAALREVTSALDLAPPTPVTHVLFPAYPFERGPISFDAGDTTLQHEDGTRTARWLTGTAADPRLDSVSQLYDDIGEDSVLSVDLAAGIVTYTCQADVHLADDATD